jgi:predicted TIM-barrel fold metal-dependent hydrolase
VNDKTAAKPADKKFIYQIREDWLALRREEPIDLSLPIIDPHHHLWDRGLRYLLDELKGDVETGGHNIRATVYVQCGSMYRAEGDPKFAPVGETEFVNGVAAMSASNLYGPARLCAGIVGFADLLLGAEVDEVLEAHLRAAGGRFKGVRHPSVWDADPSIRTTQAKYPQGLLLNAKFRAGFARLSRYGLSFDSWNYHTQIAELTDLARAFPETTIVLDHIGAPLGVGAPYAGRRDEVFADWRRNIRDLAKCPNVRVKLGGMGMRIFGFGFDDQPLPPSSDHLAKAWWPYLETCIDAFGPQRAMFESNFPVDKVYCSYCILWNAFKKLTAAYSAAEKAGLFFNTAKRTYRLPTTADASTLQER